ncbi:uncharacterized protein [Spinacia oleracea]|uniref:Uncharacterized protein isoform X2 n=1 Tax=Spinacia oleracea TaxID=3562 RepID=A0ABM3RAG7_SPIOL|nr:uncharacterized protein LOC130467805 isoform X2 [Spinacia oleracea]
MRTWSNTIGGGSGAAGLSSTLETGGSSGSIMFAASRAGAGAPDGRSVSGAAISSNALGSTGVIGYSSCSVSARWFLCSSSIAASSFGLTGFQLLYWLPLHILDGR